jgi:multidrug efflux pump subunit AcrA (membrane-fusion protein)
VFDSAGPEGRVRGTPQQIIEKYRGLAHDALMGDDRVAAESFQQHAEHYSRILLVAQRQIAERQAEQQAQQAERQAEQQAQQAERQAEQQARQAQQQQQQQKEQAKAESEQPNVGESFAEVSNEQPEVVEHIVATPENKPRNRGPRRKPAKDTSNEVDQAVEDQPQPN